MVSAFKVPLVPWVTCRVSFVADPMRGHFGVRQTRKAGHTALKSQAEELAQQMQIH